MTAPDDRTAPKEMARHWVCVYCGWCHDEPALELATARCNCGVGKGRWGVETYDAKLYPPAHYPADDRTAKQSEPLLPCPFCGGRAKAFSIDASVVCIGCEAEIVDPLTGDVDVAIAAWNRRASRPSSPQPTGEQIHACDRVERQRNEFRRCLTELLRLYDWRKELCLMNKRGEIERDELERAHQKCRLEKKKAWETARAALLEGKR